MGAYPVNSKEGKSKQNPAFQFRDLEDILEA